MIIRNHKSLAWLACFVVATFALSALQTASAEPFKRKSSGWVVQTGLDFNENGENLFMIMTFGNGTFGQSKTSMQNEYEYESFLWGCGDYPEELPTIRFRFTSSSLITRFANGDMLFAVMDTEGPSSFLCVDLSSERTSASFNLIIQGGTGRFEGATGWLKVRNHGTSLLSASGEFPQIAIEEEVKGQVFLNREDPDDNDQSHD